MALKPLCGVFTHEKQSLFGTLRACGRPILSRGAGCEGGRSFGLLLAGDEEPNALGAIDSRVGQRDAL